MNETTAPHPIQPWAPMPAVLWEDRPKAYRVPKAHDSSLPDKRDHMQTNGDMRPRYMVDDGHEGPWYTNGYVMVKGEHKLNGTMTFNARTVLPSTYGAPAKPVGWQHDGCADNVPIVWFDDGNAVNAGIVLHVLKAHPGGTWQTHGRLAALTYHDKQGFVVALAMPMRLPYGVPVELAHLINVDAQIETRSYGLKEWRKAAKQAHADVKDLAKRHGEALTKDNAKSTKASRVNVAYYLRRYNEAQDRRDFAERVVAYLESLPVS